MKMLEIANQILVVPTPASATTPAAPALDTAVVNNEARESFLKNVPADFTDLRSVSQEFARTSGCQPLGQSQEFCRQTHHLAGAAASARCHTIALLSGALEALLYELGEKPQFINLPPRILYP